MDEFGSTKQTMSVADVGGVANTWLCLRGKEEITEQTETTEHTEGLIHKPFRPFRYFRLFRNLFFLINFIRHQRRGLRVA